MDPRTPTIGVVVVHFGAASSTLDCLAGLERTQWPRSRLRVVLVDNAGDAALTEGVRRRYPWAQILAPGGNAGYGRACNLGIAALDAVDAVALVNNDTVPDPGWLAPLAEALRCPGVGAANPKVVLSDRQVTIALRCPASTPLPAGEWRDLGVQLSGARVDGEEVSDAIRLGAGFWGWEHDAGSPGARFSWSSPAGAFHVPAPGEDRVTVEVRLASPFGATRVELRAGDGAPRCVEVPSAPTWIPIGDVGSETVLNNAGTTMDGDGSSRDRGYLEADRGQFDVPGEVFGWSGAAVLLSKAMLDDVGPFDERFFLYYEDVDLAVRGRLRGWRYRYVPAATVRHRHSASIGEDAPLTRHLSRRNHLLMVAKVAPGAIVAAAFGEQLRAVGRAAATDVVARWWRGQPPIVRHVADELRVVAGTARRLPPSVAQRRRIRERARRTPAEVWQAAGELASQDVPREPTAISQVRGRTWEP